MEFNLSKKRRLLEDYMGVAVAVTDYGQFRVMNTIFDVLDRHERVEVATVKVRKGISQMNSNFLANMTGLDKEVFEKLVGEDEAVTHIVDCSCGLERFVKQIAEFDGWGKILAEHDDKELDIGQGYFAYRLK